MMDAIYRAERSASLSSGCTAEQTVLYDVCRDYAVACRVSAEAFAAVEADETPENVARWCAANARCRELMPLLGELPFVLAVALMSVKQRVKNHRATDRSV